MARGGGEQRDADRARNAKSQRTLSPVATAGFAAVLGAIGALALFITPSSGPVLTLAFVVLPLVSWWFVTRDVTTALVFTTIGEMYSGNSGAWLSIGPLSIRWILIFTTIAVNMLIRMWMWRPASHKRTDSRSPHALQVLFFGGLFPIVLYAIAMIGTNNTSSTAFQSLGFMLVLLFYFPLRHALDADPLRLVALVIGLSITLALLMLSMSVGPIAVRQQINATVFADLSFGDTITGITRIMPAHIVLMFFPILLSIFELTRANGIFRKVAFAAAALFFLLPMTVTFLMGTLISLLIMLLVSGCLLTMMPMLRRYGKAIVIAVAVLAATVLSAAIVLTPDLLESKLFSRTGMLSSGVGEQDARRLSEWLVVADDFQNYLWLGHGAGATMTVDESGPENGHTVEMEGLMTFHLFGALGCAVLLVGFAVLAFHPLATLRKRKSFDRGMAVSLAFWATACAIIGAGMINPYLTTPFPALFVGLYLVWDERVLSRSSG
jgi:hypothetical protein